tara:strand:- start:49 stop:702 length:654 start_codon:yes stop_codon:yes gene_type:complete
MNNIFQRLITSVVLLLFLSISLFFNKHIWLFTLILVSLVLFIEFNNLTKKIWKKEKKIIASLNTFSLLFLVILIYVSYKSYYIPPIGLIFIISICILSDTGGYLVGNLIGGRKLTKISPNKTISGSLGSFIFSLFSIVIFWFGDRNFVTENYLKLIPTCLFLCLICQLGDLFISYFKRQANVKNTGSILPGHGGLLDRIDGVIFVLPAAYTINNLFF